MGPIFDSFWVPFGAEFGLQNQPKFKSNFDLISDTMLGRILDPLLAQKWIHVGVISVDLSREHGFR